ncbi:unnamed protein product [Acanthoscelides obtectus]|uniref:Uncharacterized protein n=1 Tax=Acanthoscelides obtectus TaxID=200917 RepID=A0A9P0NVY0_ACAOB|nr:unnamed protein product [Acanthoscelides obtectus]CAK1678983.1 hypothetical protein AOBTE_LOCUS32082 [Acanthoscelides obtectus]
MLKQLCKQ